MRVAGRPQTRHRLERELRSRDGRDGEVVPDRLANSKLFILYYPALLAFAFVFPPRPAAIYVGLTLALYVGACVIAPDVSQAPVVDSAVELKRIIFRVITMASVGALGTLYWGIQRNRLRSASGRPPSPPRSVRPEAL